MAKPSDYAILQVLPQLETGGVEQVVVELTEAVARTGARALVASLPGKLVPAIERAGGTHIPLDLKSRNPFRMSWNGDQLAKLIKSQRVSLIHAHSRAPAFAARAASMRRSIPFVTTYHGAYNQTGPLKSRYNAVMAGGDRVIAISTFIADLVRARHHIGDDKLRIVPGGVDPARFDPDAINGGRVERLARAWRLPDGAPTIMLPARLTAWKGQQVMIAALAKLRHRDAILILVGSAQGRDAYLKSLSHLAQSLDVAKRVLFAGDCADMPAAYKLADVVVNASTDPEAFGRTIVEAQAMRRLVIATDHGAARETIRANETGWRVPPNDPAALAAAIDQALDLPVEARIAIGAAARDFVATNYAVSTMQAGNLAVYHELLG
ncbi:MAG: glycosyl transferase [Acidiphilium sp. 37-64-53]|uniref:glycosyltransferase family 4 protein n=1 Tax=Acidiphilium TaxID=522 RepID=UPI000BC46BD3|nr:MULTISPECIES: glycosyltransferase family 4 protein [Acidiphilium]OYW01732.1 MAG: glycosyl transferase [Acidiphilium sp. 37-64-53]OZB28976.1 MAG: glycosyl transferase [Acidiphilium sp. 34-64-41]HQT85806.1 glycosyltransferase family 4 protein [Acidiphilium rubrum]